MARAARLPPWIAPVGLMALVIGVVASLRQRTYIEEREPPPGIPPVAPPGVPPGVPPAGSGAPPFGEALPIPPPMAPPEDDPVGPRPGPVTPPPVFRTKPPILFPNTNVEITPGLGDIDIARPPAPPAPPKLARTVAHPTSRFVTMWAEINNPDSRAKALIPRGIALEVYGTVRENIGQRGPVGERRQLGDYVYSIFRSDGGPVQGWIPIEELRFYA